ncbi:Crp/Fnr family transcriptional regulator [Altericroceibacterium xinjiangense]|uniref:Crp/Fnr family transcriptional regulator n=1 Tax=Altericroceibacterium xinjiangense TaxID=762261 RepID=UPI000F7DDA94|nr:helix-turn-helix domain-containing protein [Altericroceibacterium xinjiangense]
MTKPAASPIDKSFCQACTVRKRAICADLDEQEIAALNSIGRQRKLSAGEQLLWEGEDAVLVANVIDGVLKLWTGTADGRQQIVGLVYASDFIGRPFGATTPYGVEALSEANVCVFSRKEFDTFAREHPRLEHKLLERTLAELDRTRKWMLLLGRKNAEEKLATFLIDMSERLVEPGSNPLSGEPLTQFELPFSRQQIADVLGLTIETVSRNFARFKREGVIDLPSRREVHILDRAALEAMAG